jgi:hypothetical protein
VREGIEKLVKRSAVVALLRRLKRLLHTVVARDDCRTGMAHPVEALFRR